MKKENHNGSAVSKILQYRQPSCYFYIRINKNKATKANLKLKMNFQFQSFINDGFESDQVSLRSIRPGLSLPDSPMILDKKIMNLINDLHPSRSRRGSERSNITRLVIFFAAENYQYLRPNCFSFKKIFRHFEKKLK